MSLRAGLWTLLGRIDWRLVLMLGPRHRFSEAQWQRLALMGRLTATGWWLVAFNTVYLAILFSAGFGADERLHLDTRLLAPMLMICVPLVATLLTLWRRPTMKRLYLSYGLMILVAAPVALVSGHGPLAKALLLSQLGDDALGSQLRMRYQLVCTTFTVLAWLVAVWRNEYLAQWLREQDRQQEALELARRLASAQIQPHFLFNALASLQHWVQMRDERAAPLLGSLTEYLRATLPLFERPLLSVAEEAQAVRCYLEVMQARLGSRLRYRLEIDPDAAATELPPGVLLTLVENAVEHGVQPQLGGGEVVLRARRDARDVVEIEVLDDGPGLPQGATPEASTDGSARGLGLRNTHARLAQAFGARARLSLHDRPDRGCAATVRVLPAPAG